MKRTLLCFLLSAGMIFGSASALFAAPTAEAIAPPTPTDTAALTAQADSLAVLAAPTAAQAKTDSLLQELGQRVSDLDQAVSQLRNSYSHSSFKAEQVMVVLIVALIASAIVLMVFLTLKFAYRRREKRYELERLRIERGEQLSGPPVVVTTKTEISVTVFIRRLLITAIVGFGILAWVGVVNLSYMRFFSILLVWILIAAVGYAVVHLFRVYVQRCDENR